MLTDSYETKIYNVKYTIYKYHYQFVYPLGIKVTLYIDRLLVLLPIAYKWPATGQCPSTSITYTLPQLCHHWWPSAASNGRRSTASFSGKL